MRRHDEEEIVHCITAGISVGALRENIRLLRGMMDPGAEFCAVVKCNAYGHGLDLLAKPVAEEADVLAVCTAAEALRLRDLGIAKPILALFSPYSIPGQAERAEALKAMIESQVALTIMDLPAIDAIAAAARGVDKSVDVHLKIDTGMHRGGVRPDDVGGALERLAGEPLLRLQGVCTHFATADDPDKTALLEQLACFHDVLDRRGVPAGLIRHVAASAAVIDLPETHLDMVRIGIAMYGCAPAPHIRERVPLRPVLRLTAPLMQIKSVGKGARTGYGLTYTFPADTRIGLVPVGYGDGYLRCLSNRGEVTIGGRAAPVCGRVSMDQIVVDLGGVPDAEPGDEVVVISDDPAAPNSAENLARLAGTIPYEILTAVGTARVRRVMVA